jgi:hypothetical protein
VDVAVDLLAEVLVAFIDLDDALGLAAFDQADRAAGEDAPVALQVGSPGGIADFAVDGA